MTEATAAIRHFLAEAYLYEEESRYRPGLSTRVAVLRLEARLAQFAREHVR